MEPLPVGHRPPRCTEHPRGFRAGCRRCRSGKSWYARHRKAGMEAGTWAPGVPVEAVAAHIAELRAGGITDTQIAKWSGVSRALVQRLRQETDPGRTVRAINAHAILGVCLPPVADRRGYVPVNGGIIRRVHALCRSNYPLATIADAIGHRSHTQASLLASGTAKTITVADAASLAAFYAAHVRRPRPGPRAVSIRAVRAGWLPWYVWADDIDDPHASPDDPIDCIIPRRMMRALAAMGWGPAHLAVEFPAVTPAELDAAMRAEGDRGDRRPRVRRMVTNIIRHAYDMYGDLPGPDEALLAEARERRWVTSAAWDGRDITDPRACPSRGVGLAQENPLRDTWTWTSIWLAIGGDLPATDLTRIERCYVVGYLRRLGWSDTRIGEWLRWDSTDPQDAIKRFMTGDRRPALPRELLTPAEIGAADRRIAGTEAADGTKALVAA